MRVKERPLSPHLQVYRPQLTSMLSITHRATGVVGSVGFIFLVAWLVAAAGEGDAFSSAQKLWGSLIGQLALVAFSFSFFYHLCNGIRHLFWDIGKGLDLDTTYRSGWATVVASLVLTGGLWIYAMGAST